MKRVPLLPLLCAVLPATAPAAAEFQVFGALPGELIYSEVNAVNADGTVLIGTGHTGVDNQAFIWTREAGFTLLGILPGAHNSYGKGISSNGRHVVGHSLSNTDGYPTPFIWNAEDGLVPIPRMPEGEQATACDVSDDGTIVVGGADTAESFSINNQAARWVNGVPEPLGDLPGGNVGGEAYSVSSDGLSSTGYSSIGGPLGAFLHRPDTGMINLGRLPGKTGYGGAEALAISATGKYVVGTTRNLTDPFQVMFIWSQAGGMRNIGRIGTGDYNTTATGVNRKGTIVVGRSTPKGLIWTAKHGTKELGPFLEQELGLNLDGWRPETAVISDDGTTIAGKATKKGFSGYYAYLAVIPASLANDSDADGLDDEWELEHFAAITPAPAEDFDHDGTDNLSEFQLGLMPNNGSSRFALKGGANGSFEWPGSAGLSFKIERSPDLQQWTVLEEALPGSAGAMSYTDPAPLPRTGFYRVTLND